MRTLLVRPPDSTSARRPPYLPAVPQVRVGADHVGGVDLALAARSPLGALVVQVLAGDLPWQHWGQQEGGGRQTRNGHE